MQSNQHTTPPVAPPTTSDVCRWAQALWKLHARLAPRFARKEPYQRALAFLQGIVSETVRKNGWQLAEHAGEARPDGMQRLLSRAVWDQDGVRDDLRTYLLEQLGTTAATVVIDETSFAKRGKKSAGVGPQYCGSTGQVQNCQVGVFLSYVTAKGHSLIDRELYLPLDWCEDLARRQEAAIPSHRPFQTKPELARAMLQRLFQVAVSIDWVVADTVYGSNLDLRNWLEEQGTHYVMAVACTEPVALQSVQGRIRVEAAAVERVLAHPVEWQRLSMGQGTKGPRFFDWVALPMLSRWQDDAQHFLLIRRNLSDESQKRYYFVFAPPATPLSELVQAIGSRWHIEEDFETGKGLGLSDYEVRSWLGWYRHITLVMLAHAFLTGIVVQSQHVLSSQKADSCQRVPVIALTVAEVCRLLARLIWPGVRSWLRVLAWSWWRRSHQGRASASHRKRRWKALPSVQPASPPAQE